MFSNIKVAYSDILNQTSGTIVNVAQIREIRINNNTQNWFDNEIAETIKTRSKYIKKIEK